MVALAFSGPTIAVCTLALWAAIAAGAPPIVPSPALPETTPWNLALLGKPPGFEWIDRTGPVVSLLYDGEPDGGKLTRVFAYYATPGSLIGDRRRHH